MRKMEGRIEELKETAKAVEKLFERAQMAAIEYSSKHEGYPKEIAEQFLVPLAEAVSYFKDAVNETEGPEMQKNLDNLPVEQLQKVYKLANYALGTEIEKSISYYAKGLSTKRGVKLLEQDVKEISPIFSIQHFLRAYGELKNTYQPSV